MSPSKRKAMTTTRPVPSAHAAATSRPQEASSYHSLSHAYKTYLSHDKDEQNHWDDVCKSYRQYASFAMAQWANHQYRLLNLSQEQQKVLPAGLRRGTPEYEQRAKSYKEAAIRNQFSLDCILRHTGQPHSQESPPSPLSGHPSDSQMSRVSSVLKSLVRDWSAEGKEERDMAYKPLLDCIQKHVPLSENGSQSSLLPRICVPGAGVGRLAWEISALGYAVQGNEFSLFMLLASDFILNGGIATPQTPLRISPWLLESRNVHCAGDPLRAIPIPDVDPYAVLAKPTVPTTKTPSQPPPFSMAAGEFVSIYGAPKEKGQWDAVVACFFLDASPSIVEYLQVIHQMLKPGGVLINFGPLLWHWSGPAMRPDDKTVDEYRARFSYLDKKYLESVDLTWEDIREIMINIGFDIVESSTEERALYTADPQSMMTTDYRCICFVAKKRNPDAAAKPEVASSSEDTDTLGSTSTESKED